MGVGGEGLGAVEPFLGEEGVVHDEVVEFLLAGLVVADVAVVDGGVAVVLAVGQADKEKDGDECFAPLVKNATTLTLTDFSRCIAIPAEIVAVDFVELLDEAFPEAGTGAGVKPSAVGNKTNQATLNAL